MQEQIDQVRTFHETRDIAHECDMPTHHSPTLKSVARELGHLARALEANIKLGDPRILRAHLLVEEVGELCQSMATGDLVETADGLGDLAYVTLGSAVQFKLPLAEIFEEIHRSNMTKAGGGSSDPRVRDKGRNYEPPRIKELLDERELLARRDDQRSLPDHLTIRSGGGTDEADAGTPQRDDEGPRPEA